MKYTAIFAIAYAFIGLFFVAIVSYFFRDFSTALERTEARWEYIVVLLLGSILWRLINNKAK